MPTHIGEYAEMWHPVIAYVYRRMARQNMEDDEHDAPPASELWVMNVHVFWKLVFAGPHEAEILRRFDMELHRLPFDEAVARLRNEDIWRIMVLSESEAFRVIQEVEAAGMRAKLVYE